MACVDEFGIIDQIEEAKDYSEEYLPEQYHCVTVNDDLVNDFAGPLIMMKTYWHRLDRPEFGLARYGVTLIPPESLTQFYDVVSVAKDFSTSRELVVLAALIEKARTRGKYMIHYGI